MKPKTTVALYMVLVAINDAYLLFSMADSTQIVSTLGTVCVSNNTCTGPNEYCNIVTEFEKPCQKGLCECLPCHGLNNRGICSPYNHLENGHACFGEPNEVIIVEHAACYLGVVSCKSGFTQHHNYCGYDGGFPYLSKCESSYWCAGDLKCLNSSCDCIGGGAYKYNEKDKACVFKEYGDRCNSDDDCQIAGNVIIGFTAMRASCQHGRCACGSEGRVTTVAYLDHETGQRKMKPVCVHLNGSVNLGSGAVCDVDPVIGGNSPEVEVCDGHLVCVRCPEDGEIGYKGRCRRPRVLKPRPSCFKTIAEPEAATKPVIEQRKDRLKLIDDSNKKRVNWRDRVMAAVANRTWNNNGLPYRQCSSADQCFLNEECLMPSFCHRGICVCVPPNVQDSYQHCLTPPVATALTITAPALNDQLDLDNITISTSTTPASVVFEQQSNEEYYEYGMQCSSAADCALIGLNCHSATIMNGQVQNGLHCLPNDTDGDSNNAAILYCQCQSAKYKWDQATFRCKPKEFGDYCTTDRDCDTGTYTKEAVGGFKCMTESNSCGCAPEFAAVTVVSLSAVWGAVMPRNMAMTINKKTYCVSANSHKPDVASFGNCTVDLIGDSTKETFTCSSGYVCLYCPGDTNFGSCTNLAAMLEYSSKYNTDFDNALSSGNSDASRFAVFMVIALLALLLPQDLD